MTISISVSCVRRPSELVTERVVEATENGPGFSSGGGINQMFVLQTFHLWSRWLFSRPH